MVKPRSYPEMERREMLISSHHFPLGDYISANRVYLLGVSKLLRLTLEVVESQWGRWRIN